jgi:hypothetical protein
MSIKWLADVQKVLKHCMWNRKSAIWPFRNTNSRLQYCGSNKSKTEKISGHAMNCQKVQIFVSCVKLMRATLPITAWLRDFENVIDTELMNIFLICMDFHYVLLDLQLWYINPVSVFMPHCFKFHFNVFLPTISRSPKWFLTSGFWINMLYVFLICSFRIICHRHLNLLNFSISLIFDKEYKCLANYYRFYAPNCPT